MTKNMRMIAAVVAAIGVALAGCSNQEPPAAPAALEPDHDHGPPASVEVPALPGLPEPFADVDQYDAGEVMDAAVHAVFAWEPATDASMRDAVVRARPLLDERYFERADQSFVSLAPVTGAEWDRWADAGATTRVRATETNDAHPPDKQAARTRVWDVEVDVLDRDGQTIATKNFAVYATVTLMGVWRLSDLAVR